MKNDLLDIYKSNNKTKLKILYKSKFIFSLSYNIIELTGQNFHFTTSADTAHKIVFYVRIILAFNVLYAL